MAVRKVQKRGGSRKPTQREATATEAAHIMQSYLVEHNFTRTLAEFRSEAAPILSGYKKGAETNQGVKSLSTVLRDYVALGNELEASREANSELQRALKQGADALQGLYKFYETLVVSPAGCPPQNYPARNPLLTPETQPPCPSLPGSSPCSPIHPGLNKTAGVAKDIDHTRLPLKRKSTVTVKSLPGSATDNSTEAAAAAKRAYQPPSGLPKSRWSTPSSASGPTCPGVVRKTNRVRNGTSNAPAKVLFDEEIDLVNSPTVSPSLKLPNCPIPQARSPASDASAPTEPPKHSRDDPQTPPQSWPEHEVPDNRCSTADDPGLPHQEGAAEGSAASSTPPFHDLQNDQGDVFVTREGSSCGQPSPDSRSGSGARMGKMSKTMRPLDFVSPILCTVPDADHVTHNMEETLEDLSADPQPIDDILNSLNDDPDLDSLGDILHSSCTEDVLISYGRDSLRSPIGEDSFGFDSLLT